MAVKVFKTGLSQWGANPSDVMLRELELLKFVSRDKNVVQFYGCCVKGDHVMLVTELMEVCVLCCVCSAVCCEESTTHIPGRRHAHCTEQRPRRPAGLGSQRQAAGT